MAKLNIQLVWNANTRKRDIIVDFTSDSDALPHEHEQDHQDIIKKLIEGGLIKAGEVGDLIIERVEDTPVELDQPQEQGQPQAESLKRDN